MEIIKVTRFRNVISQPLVHKAPSEWDFDREQFEHATSVAKLCGKQSLSLVGADDETLFKIRSEKDGVKEYEYLRPAEIQCTYCPALADCPAARAVVAECVDMTAERLADPEPLQTVEIPVVGSPKDIAGFWQKVRLVRKWCDAVESKAFSLLKSGQITQDDGLKLVEGRDGNRVWKDPEEAEKALKDWRYKTEQMYSMSLISPTQAEKLMSENPRRWKKLQENIVRSPAKLEIALVTDRRNAVNVAPSDDGFEVIPEEPQADSTPQVEVGAPAADDGSDLC